VLDFERVFDALYRPVTRFSALWGFIVLHYIKRRLKPIYSEFAIKPIYSEFAIKPIYSEFAIKPIYSEFAIKLF